MGIVPRTNEEWLSFIARERIYQKVAGLKEALENAQAHLDAARRLGQAEGGLELHRNDLIRRIAELEKDNA